MKYSPRSSGIAQMLEEMRHQHADAQASFDSAEALAPTIADAIRHRGRLALLGMGGSHWLNRIVCPHYLAAGMDASCHVASEYIRAPLPGYPAMLLVSQSGNSGEIVRLIDLGLTSDHSFGLTLDAKSKLAMALPSLIGHGSPETAYAATRSLFVTLALHAAILAQLGVNPSITIPDTPFEANETQHAMTVAKLTTARNAVMVARGNDQGIMDAAALCLMETARIPVLGLEAGQFRHGPFEMVNADTVVVFLRSQGRDADDAAPLIAECVHHGMVPCVFDASGKAPVDGALTVALPSSSGLDLAFNALPVVQAALVEAADRMVTNAGIPNRSTKVTSAETV